MGTLPPAGRTLIDEFVQTGTIHAKGSGAAHVPAPEPAESGRGSRGAAEGGPVMARGIIRISQWCVNCGICENGQVLADGRPGAKALWREARQYGWRRTRQHGWICWRHKQADSTRARSAGGSWPGKPGRY
jgi:hypothetical protein